MIECSQVSDVRVGPAPKVNIISIVVIILIIIINIIIASSLNSARRCFLFNQDAKISAELEMRGTGTLEQRTVTVCSGLDLVNITYNNFVATNSKIANVGVLFAYLVY